MKISICIPTRERAEYLAASLSNVTAIPDPELEIVISDNASADNTRQVVESFADPRIRYVNTGRRISQRENFENVVRASSGDYVMTMGDDDAVLPGQWHGLRYLLKTRQPPALTWQPIFYCWPSPYYRAGGGMLRLTHANMNGTIERVACADILAPAAALTLGRHERLPEIYHGVASRGLIDQFIERTGHVFMSANIDVYYSYGALGLASHFDRIRHPFSIIAMGPKSGGGSMQAQGKTGQNSEILSRVAGEANADPVKEQLAMPFPALAFHLLGGMIEAERRIFSAEIGIGYQRWLGILQSQMHAADDAARQQAREILTPYFTLHGRADLLEALDSALVKSGAEKSVFAHINAKLKRVESWFSGLSYVLPGKIELDLKSKGLARVDDTARVADWLLDPEWPKKSVSDDAPSLAWRAAQMRAAKLILGMDRPPSYGQASASVTSK